MSKTRFGISQRRRWATLGCTAWSVTYAAGCAAPLVAHYRAEAYRIEASLIPDSRSLQARAAIDLGRTDDPRDAGTSAPMVFDVLLHADLSIQNVTAAGSTVRSVQTLSLKPNGNPEPVRTYRIHLSNGPSSFTLFVDYGGAFRDLPLSPESQAHIASSEARIGVGPNDVFLPGTAFWYPRPADRLPREPVASIFTLLIEPLPGFQVAACGDRDVTLEKQTGRWAWRTPFPIESLAVMGDRRKFQERKCGTVRVAVQRSPAHDPTAADLLDHSCRRIEAFEAVLGSFPVRQFSLIEFPSGHTLEIPQFHLVDFAEIRSRGLDRTGQSRLDHDLLKSWWGHGIRVNESEGDWAAAVRTFVADFVVPPTPLTEIEARRRRRNACYRASLPATHSPISGARQEGESSPRATRIAQEGAMVFHMLAHKLGDEAFLSVLRRFSRDRVGQSAGWSDLESSFETEGFVEVSPIFEQWVRGPGAPAVAINEITRNSHAPPGTQLNVRVSVDRLASAAIDVPIRIVGESDQMDHVLAVTSPSQWYSVTVPFSPTHIELDPDYHLLRTVPEAMIVPTPITTRRGPAFALVLPNGPLVPGYAALSGLFEASYAGRDRAVFYAGAIPSGALSRRSLLIVGPAVHDPHVAAFLSAVEFPVRWNSVGFEFGGIDYADPAHAVHCSIRHPDHTMGGITVIYGNTNAAIPDAGDVFESDRSLVIYRKGISIESKDFELRMKVPIPLSD